MKNMSARKLAVTVMSIVLVLMVLSGCFNKKTNEEPQSSSSGQTGNPNAEPKPIVEFTVLALDPEKQIAQDDAPIIKQVNEKTNVRLKWEVPPAEVEEKLNTLLAGGEYPDVIFIEDPAIAQKYIDGGHVIPLDDLIEKHGAQFKKIFGDDLNKLRNKDGKIYHLPANYIMPGSKVLVEYTNVFNIHSKVLEDKGWYKPDTFESIYKLLKDVKKDYPEFVPMSLALGQEDQFKSIIDLLAYASGVKFSGDYVWNDDDTLTYRFKDSRIREGIKWLNLLYREGLLDQESAVLTLDALKLKINAGQVFSTMGNWFDLTYEANTLLAKQGSKDRYTIFAPKASADTKQTTYLNYSINYDSGWYITKNNINPELFMDFANFLNTEEGWAAQYGIINFDGEDKEGYDFYAVEEDGQQVLATTRFSREGWADDNFAVQRGYFQFGDFTYTNNLVQIPPEFKYNESKTAYDFSGFWDDDTKRINKAYGDQGSKWVEDNKAAWDATNIANLFVDPNRDEAVIYTKVKQTAYDELVRAIFTKSESDFDAKYDAFLKKIDGLGISQWESEMNNLYHQRLKNEQLK